MRMIRYVALGTLAAVTALACSSTDDRIGQSNAAVDMICSESPAATLDGIPAYAYCGNFNVWSNNGSDTKSTSGGAGWVQTEGGYGYQCVEYAARYEHFKFGVSAAWGISYAYQMCNTHPSGISTVTTPVHGDLIIFAPGSCGADGTAGHVAVVDTVGSTTVGVVQENSAGKYTYQKSCASCWLHAANNNGTNDPCAAAVDGLYCGQSSQFAGGAKDVLYDCQGGATATKTTCANGCIVEPPGTSDKCAAPPPSDAGTDATPQSDAAAQSDASSAKDSSTVIPDTDAGGGTPSSGGCSVTSTSTSTRTSTLLTALGALLLLARRKQSR